LVAKIQSGDTLTLTGVPPGAGTRMGIDRNLDGVLDADVPRPSLQIAAAGNVSVLAWPFAAAGFLLEESTNLSGVWTSSTNPVEIVNGFNYVTNSPANGTKFFRLRMP
jgi:hypothetical protein